MTTNGAMPAKWQMTETVYGRMLSEAEDIDGLKVWEGFTTGLFDELEIPKPYYGDILGILKAMGCIQQLRRGGRTTKSRWALFKTPDPKEYEQFRPMTPAAQKKQEYEDLAQQIADVRESLGGIDVAKALYDVVRRLDKLEAGVGEEHPA